MTNFRDTAKAGIMAGIEKGWSGYVWLLRILIPISFLTVLLDYSGLIQQTDFLLAPVMKLISMPAAAAIPLVVGMLTGIYGGIAAMIVLPFSVNQMTLIAIFLLISHNLVQEGMVQGRSGLSPLKATAIRLAASIVTVIAVAQFMDLQPGASTGSCFWPAGSENPVGSHSEMGNFHFFSQHQDLSDRDGADDRLMPDEGL